MKAIVKSDSTFPREYENIKTRSALVIANEVGRCESGEKVEVRTNNGKLVDLAIWDGLKYYRAYCD